MSHVILRWYDFVNFLKSFHSVGVARMLSHVGIWFQSPNSHSHGNNTLESSEGEHRIRDLNDEINKDLREKGYWEDQLPGTRMEVTVIFFLYREGWQKCWKTNSSSGWNYIVACRNVYMLESCLVHVAMAISWGDVHPLLKTSCDFDLNPWSHGVMLLQNVQSKSEEVM